MYLIYQKIAHVKPRVIFCFLFLIFFAVLPGQTYFFDNYSNKDGLAQSKIYDLLQDNKNYLWLGTMAGVSKFDGHAFNNFTTINGLAPGGVRSIFQDSRGNIWFGHSDGGVSTYDGKNFKVFKLANLLFHSDVTSITEDNKGRLWFTTEKSGAAVVHNPRAPVDSIKYEQYKGKRLSDRVYASMIGHDGSVYLLTDVGVKKFNEHLNNFDTFHPEGLTTYFSISCVFQDSRERFWFGTYHGGLYRYHPGKKEMRIFDIRDGLSSNFISTISEDSDGNLWVGTWGGGITRINDEVLKVFDNTNGLNDNKIRSIVGDHEGNIMIGSNDNGLFIFKGEKFVRYGEEIVADPQVWALEQDGMNRLWIGTNKGITLLEGENYSTVYKQFNRGNSNIGEMIRFLKKDSQNNIWVAAEGSGIYKYDAREKSFYYFSELNYLLFRDFIVTGLEIDAHGNLWAGTNEGITFYNTSKRKGIRLTQINGISGNEISSLYLDDEDQLWVGARGKKLNMIDTRLMHQIIDTISGINLPTFNFEGKGIERYELGLGITPRSFVKDKQGTLWIGTEGQGLLKFANDTVLGKFTRDDGLLANLVNLLETDADGNVYVGTNKGLNVLRPGGRIISYTSSNGFTGIETKNNAVIVDEAGNLWFGTMNGAIKFNKKEANKGFPEPVIYITGLTVNLEDYPVSSMVELNYLQNRVGFHYGTVNFTNPDAIRYQYMLSGAEDEWLPVTDQTTVTYTSLPPGKYEFRVRAVNYAGVWNEKPASVQLVINPPFYKTWWFILSAILLGITMLSLYVKLRERKFVREKQVLEQKVRSRTREVTLASRELARKNKNITDSIRYAKRIQLSLLPDELPYKDTFILFKPKDIVSGDFFWFHNTGEHEFMAAVDCTGHGVPGAFMSIIGHNALNKIINEYKIIRPSEILDQLNVEVSNTLHQQSESSVHDGMDLSLICINRSNKSLQYSAAFNPLYIVRGGELLEYRGNRFSIGKIRKKREFENHEIKLEDGDIIYMFSDGYADQFGGTGERKFKASAVKDLLIRIKDKPMEKQKEVLNDTIENWRGTLEQVDDILFIGRRFTSEG